MTNKKSITNEKTKTKNLLIISNLSLNFQNKLLLTDLLIVYENHNSAFGLKMFLKTYSNINNRKMNHFCNKKNLDLLKAGTG